jgi:CheY-like chemotaxis protein
VAKHHWAFAFLRPFVQGSDMTQPLALFLYEKALPSGQLVNRLQDLGYRVQSISDPATLLEWSQREKPLLVLADLEPKQEKVCAAISQLKANNETAHIPIIAFASSRATPAVQSAAREAGATLVVTDTAILTHLNQFLDQAIQVD